MHSIVHAIDMDRTFRCLSIILAIKIRFEHNVRLWVYAMGPSIVGCGFQPIGPATHCDAAHLRWGVLNPLRCITIACDVLRYIFQHVGNLSPYFGIPELYIVRL